MEIVRAKGWADLNSRSEKIKKARQLGLFEEAIEEGHSISEASFRAGAAPRQGRRLMRLYQAS